MFLLVEFTNETILAWTFGVINCEVLLLWLFSGLFETVLTGLAQVDLLTHSSIHASHASQILRLQ